MAMTFLVNAGALGAARTFLALSQVLVLPVVARFLDPVEFGDMALAMSVVVFAQMLSDAGMGRSLIRQSHHDEAEWNSVFWLLMSVGLILMLVLLVLAPVWASVFERPGLQMLLSVLAVLPLLNALSAVAVARMEKDGQFPRIAFIRVAAGVAGLIAVLGLAIAGAGVWALVVQQVVLAAVQTIGACLCSRFRPGAPRNFTPLGAHVRFASDNVGVSLLFTVQRQAPILLIGTVLGAASLGLFSMAERFLTLPRTAVAGPVSQVVFVRMTNVQKDLRSVAEIYNASCLAMALVVFPPMAVLAGSGNSLFPLLLSDTWASAATVFALAAPGIMAEVATSSGGVMFQALDRTRLRLRMIAEKTVLRTVAIAVAAPFGIEAAALAITLFSLAYLPRYIAFMQRAAPVSGRAVLGTLAVPALVSAVVWIALAASAALVTQYQMLGLACVALVFAWGAGFLLQFKRVRQALETLSG